MPRLDPEREAMAELMVEMDRQRAMLVRLDRLRRAAATCWRSIERRERRLDILFGQFVTKYGDDSPGQQPTG